MTNKKIIEGIKERMDAVAKERDTLDEFISELNDLREDCDNAWECLQQARDALSELV